MRKFLPIANFAQSGVNSDLMPWDLPAEFLTEIRNVRITRNALVPFGGYLKWADLPVDFTSGYLMHVGEASGVFWLIPGKDDVYVYDGTTFTSIGNLDGYTGINNEDRWAGCMLADIAIINNPSHYPEYWPQQSAGAKMEYLPWDETQTWKDAGEACDLIRSHKQFLFALGVNSQGIEVNDAVRWSAPADIGGVPPTWDHLDTTNVAGLVNLGGSGGKIIDGFSMRDAFIVYREAGISVFDYIGGQFVWQIRHLSTSVGLVSTNALVEAEGVHYFIGDGDIIRNDGNTVQSLLHNRLRVRFSNDYDSDNFLNSYAIKSNVTSEIWFCVPTIGNVYPNIAYIYNWRNDSWSIRDIPSAPFAAYGPQGSAPDTWNSMPGTWNTGTIPWNAVQRSPFDNSILAVTKPVGAGQSGELLFLDYKNSADATLYSTNIERVGYALEGLNKVTTILTIYPHMIGPSSVFIQVGSQDHPGAPIRWKPAVLFSADDDRKIDVRTTGELHCFRIFTIDSKTDWAISGIDVEYVEAGLR